MGVHSKLAKDGSLTELMSEAVSKVAAMPGPRQDELAMALIQAADSERSDYHLTNEQLAEVDEALAEDGPYVSSAEMKAFFAQYRR